MDPLTILTAALAMATAALTLATKIWDATPAEIQRSEAANWGRIMANICGFIADIQAKINALVEPKPKP